MYFLKTFESTLLIVRQRHKPQLGDTEARVPFSLRDLGQGDNATQALVNVEIGGGGTVLVPAVSQHELTRAERDRLTSSEP